MSELPSQKKESVVFLDFDGVIRVAKEGGEFDFCQERMKKLAKILHYYGVKVVVSSDWRHTGIREAVVANDPGQENLDEIKEILEPHLDGLLHDDWATPVCGHRHDEIAVWLVRNPGVTRYLILDDFAPHFDGASLAMKERLTLCASRFGLVNSSFQRIVDYLSESSTRFTPTRI
jgi:hypothetical protein